MFPSSSLPFGIKRWSHGGLSSGLLHQAVVKVLSLQAENRRIWHFALRLLFVFLSRSPKTEPCLPCGVRDVLDFFFK